MKVIEETKLVKQVVILGKTVYRMRVTTSTFENQLYLPQQWSNLRFIGPIYEFLRYSVSSAVEAVEYSKMAGQSFPSAYVTL